ncbi:hypothetical protein A6R68_21736, partial [Neotoma lepida]
MGTKPIEMVFLLICNVIVVPHTLLNIFTAPTPDHHCWVHILDNDSVSDNDSEILRQDYLLRISIPLDSNLRPEKFSHSIQPQWYLLHFNDTFSNVTEPDTEPCVDGWMYDQSTFLCTNVTEVWEVNLHMCKWPSLGPVQLWLPPSPSTAYFTSCQGFVTYPYPQRVFCSLFGKYSNIRPGICTLKLVLHPADNVYANVFLIYTNK